jgi:hypothetical protein
VTRRVVVCTTFRSFDGSPNDRIQREFLRGLAAQTESGWELVVTLFGETGVEEALRDAKVPFTTFEGTSGEYKFSLTDVVTNGIACADRNGPRSSVLLWTTCDVVFPPNLLAEIVRRFERGDSGTSHPHRIAPSFEDFAAGRVTDAFPHGPLSPEKVNEGIDFVYFDADVFAPGSRARAVLEEYRFVDWGLFEHFLVGIAQLYAARRLNLWATAPIVKIANDRAGGAETAAYFDRAWNRNYVPMRRFLDEHALGSELLQLHECHVQFELVARTRYLRRAAVRRLRNRVGRAGLERSPTTHAP